MFVAADDVQLEAFHQGRRDALEACYREYFRVVDRSVGRVLKNADKETVVHELFFRLLSDEALRRGFRGGSMAGWLSTLAQNQAVDFARRRNRDVPLEAAPEEAAPTPAHDEELDARRVIERFKAEVLPAKWRGVFEARFIQQLDQRSAAKSLGMHRTTLAYQELRIRSLLRSFVLHMETR